MTDRAYLRPMGVAVGALLGVGCLWLVTQDIIFGDEGLFLVAYDQFLRAPEHVARATSAFWLTDVIGAVWLKVAPLPGILAMRTGAALVYAACGAIAWTTTRSLDRRAAPWGAGLAGGAAVASGYVYLEYTVLTALALTAAGALLCRGLRRRRAGSFIGAGVVIGLGVFLRVPNVLMLTLVLVPVASAMVDGTERRQAIRQSLDVALGVLIGGLAAWALMAALHDTSYVTLAVFDILRRPPTAHSSSRLLTDAARTIVLGAAQGVASWLFLAGVSVVAGPRARRPLVWAGVATLVVAHLLLGIEWPYTIIGLTSLALLLTIASPSANMDARRLAIVGLWSLALIGAGSASLPWPLLLGLWLGAPVALRALAETDLPARSRGLAVQGGAASAAFALIIITHVIPFAPYVQALAGRRPPLLPTERAVVPADRRLWPLHTSAAVATATDDFLAVLPRYVHPGDPLVASNGIPLVIYLAGAYPFLEHPYPDVAGAATVEGDVAAADWRGPWPVWIRAKFMPAADFAVTRTEGSTFGDTPQTRETLTALFRARGYRVVWSNALFEISTPPPDHLHGR